MKSRLQFQVLIAGFLAIPLALAQQQQVPDNIAEHAPPGQPAAYNHAQHLSLGLECEACHANPEPGIEMTFPPTTMCTSCHSEGGTASVVAALEASVQSGQPVTWNRVYQLIDGITWSHRPHATAGLACEACHGDVRQSTVMAETTAATAMASCISCHKAHEAEDGCVTCHAWPTDELLRSVRD